MLTRLGQVSVEHFLATFWQQQPLLIRQLYSHRDISIDANDLAGLALEAEVESRIVYRFQNGLPWQLQQGPFSEEQLTHMPATDWTLLIQGLDHWAPACADLLDLFRFIPNWRLDDIMASFAVKGGSVGPHYDQYDVFLLQASGRRKWQIGPKCNQHHAHLPDTPLRILKNMEVTEEWILEPGDCLYLPPGIPHYGVALEDCITLSVGFRSPTMDELISSLADKLCESPQNQFPLHDDLTSVQEHPGEISATTLSRLQQHIQSQLVDWLEDRPGFASWFGDYITAPKYDAVVQPLAISEHKSVEDIEFMLKDPLICWRWNEGSRFTYSVHEQQSHNLSDDQTSQRNTLVFSVDGQSYQLPVSLLKWVQLICESNVIDSGRLSYLTGRREPAGGCHPATQLLADLVNKGSLTTEYAS